MTNSPQLKDEIKFKDTDFNYTEFGIIKSNEIVTFKK